MSGPSPTCIVDYLMKVIDLVPKVPQEKQRNVLGIIVIAKAKGDPASHQELAAQYGYSQPNFARLYGRGMIKMGELIRKDDELQAWSLNHGFDNVSQAIWLRELFKPQRDSFSD